MALSNDKDKSAYWLLNNVNNRDITLSFIWDKLLDDKIITYISFWWIQATAYIIFIL